MTPEDIKESHVFPNLIMREAAHNHAHTARVVQIESAAFLSDNISDFATFMIGKGYQIIIVLDSPGGKEAYEGVMDKLAVIEERTPNIRQRIYGEMMLPELERQSSRSAALYIGCAESNGLRPLMHLSPDNSFFNNGLHFWSESMDSARAQDKPSQTVEELTINTPYL